MPTEHDKKPPVLSGILKACSFYAAVAVLMLAVVLPALLLKALA